MPGTPLESEAVGPSHRSFRNDSLARRGDPIVMTLARSFRQAQVPRHGDWGRRLIDVNPHAEGSTTQRREVFDLRERPIARRTARSACLLTDGSQVKD